jgi:hypothetical protein
MNIFAIDWDPATAAKNLCDKHIPKMIVESAQLLSTAHRLLDGMEYEGRTATGRKARRWLLADSTQDSEIYEATFINHPCTVWTRSCNSNYLWLAVHANVMCEEFELRFGHPHKTKPLIEFFCQHEPKNILNKPIEPFALAMPDEYKTPDNPIRSYRKYYAHAKSRFAKWRLPARMPDWFWRYCKENNIPMLQEDPESLMFNLALETFNKP